jgi:hypothetical protein
MTEARQFRDEDRSAALLDNAQAQMLQARQASQAGFASALGSASSIALGGLIGEGKFGENLLKNFTDPDQD